MEKTPIQILLKSVEDLEILVQIQSRLQRIPACKAKDTVASAVEELLNPKSPKPLNTAFGYLGKQTN